MGPSKLPLSSLPIARLGRALSFCLPRAHGARPFFFPSRARGARRISARRDAPIYPMAPRRFRRPGGLVRGPPVARRGAIGSPRGPPLRRPTWRPWGPVRDSFPSPVEAPSGAHARPPPDARSGALGGPCAAPSCRPPWRPRGPARSPSLSPVVAPLGASARPPPHPCRRPLWRPWGPALPLLQPALPLLQPACRLLSPPPPPPSPTAAAAAEGGGCVGDDGVVLGGCVVWE
ncbi:unnamed protein product [Closterium sp. NIES-54]